MISDDLRKAIYLSAFKVNLSVQKEDDSSVDKSLNILLTSRNIDKKEIKKRKINDEFCPDYDIPATWKWVKMGLLCDVIRGLIFSNSYLEKKDNNILVLRGGNIDSKSEKLIFTDNIYVDKNIPNSNQYLHVGDSLIVASSGTKTSVGKSAFIDEIDSNVSFGGFMMVVRPYSEIINPRYLSYNIKVYRNKIINNTNGYISNITNSILNNLLIPLPPIEEQQRIVDKIEELFLKLEEVKPIEEELKLIKNKFPNDMKKSILKSAIEGKLTIQNKNESSENLIKMAMEQKSNAVRKKESRITYKKEKIIPLKFDIPENWSKVCIGMISDISSGGTPARTNSAYWNGSIPWLKIGDLSGKNISSCSEYITEDGLKNSSAKWFEPGTILYTIFATIGNVGILNFRATTNQAIAGIKLFGDINKEYFYYVCLALKDILISEGRGCAQLNINQEILSNVEIPIPPLEEQQRIIDKLEQLLPLCDDIEKLVNE